jgi:phosphate acetyltransferase
VCSTECIRAFPREGIPSVTLIGPEEEIHQKAEKLGIKESGIRTIDLEKSDRLSDSSHIYLNLRKLKGIQFTDAQSAMRKPLYFGAMMVREGFADGSVAGSLSTTAEVLPAGIQIVGLADGANIVSSFFLMVFPEMVYTFANCGVVPDPTPDQLADIAITAAKDHERTTGERPRVALLSSSTKGSAQRASLRRFGKPLRLLSAGNQAFSLMVSYNSMRPLSQASRVKRFREVHLRGTQTFRYCPISTQVTSAISLQSGWEG